MTISILEVENRTDLKRWVNFPYDHYRGDSRYVPKLAMDELAYFDRSRNPNFEVCEVRLLLAVEGGRPVGRLCALINSLETGKLGYPRGRFGWFESIDSQEVANGLLDHARQWFQEEGCREMAGPYGFTDLDPEGLLVEGFDELPTLSGSYNPPYYQQLLENYGMEKEVDYIEYRCEIPPEFRMFERLRKRYADQDDYRVVTCRSRKELLSHADAIWDLIQQSFASLHGVVPLTKRQTDYYTKKYFSFLDPDFVKLTFSRDGELVGFFIGIPNLSRAFRKTGGRLFPTGFYHILREYRRPETVEFMLAGAKPGESFSVLSAITFTEMYDTLRKRGVRFMETNRELEDNTTVNGIWLRFNTVYSRRSRIYKLTLG